jgi:DNA processing protein
MSSLFHHALSLKDEMVAYETLWAMKDATQRSIAQLFQNYPGRPSHVLNVLRKNDQEAERIYTSVNEYLQHLSGFSVSVYGDFQYPSALRAAHYPLQLFYYRGHIELTESRCLSVVGARQASTDGLRRAARLARELVDAGFTIVSGLAAGIDTAAMEAAIKSRGKTIGVIGTPINQVYPKHNVKLQEMIAREHLLVSQVPFFRYAQQPFSTRRFYFPQRNETMAALSRATIIVEASDTSGSLTQARAAIQQGRKLFILNSCFHNANISWPRNYELKGAVRVRTTQDILDHLPSPA